MSNKTEIDNSNAFFRLIIAEARRSEVQMGAGFGAVGPIFSPRAIRWIYETAATLGLIDAEAEEMARQMNNGIRK